MEALRGGIRAKGAARAFPGGLPTLSVVTVAKNDARGLEETLSSVRGQTHPSIEQVVVDGGSTDGTQDVLRRLDDRIDLWVSGPDGGIYDAMNKGAALATGEWVQFLNAGDGYCAPDTAARVLALPIGEADLVYGATDFLGGDRLGVVEPEPLERLWRTMPFCHQSLLARRDLLAARPFDLRYRISADFDLVFAAHEEGKRFFRAGFPIARHHPGFSHASRARAVYERWRIVRRRRTGTNALASSLDPARVRIDERIVPMGPGRLRIPFLAGAIERRARSRGHSAYRWSDFRTELVALGLALRRRIDAVHFLDAEHSMLFFPGWRRRLGRLASKTRILASFHQPPGILEKTVDPGIVRRADAVLAVSSEQADFLRALAPGADVRVLLLGVDTDAFSPPEAGPPAEGRPFRCLAGGVWLRDYDAFFRTARILGARAPGAFELHAVAGRLEIPAGLDNVVAHRDVPDAELLGLYRGADALFLPLKAATANNVLLEGMACGLPIVSSDLAAVREYAGNGGARLVKGNDPEAFASELEALRRDPDLRARMSRASRARALSLSWQNIAVEYARLYEETP